MVAAEELAARVGSTAPACRALSVPRASLYRRRRPRPSPASPRPRSHRALRPAEQKQILDVLRSPRFADRSPAQVWATLLDEMVYHCSIRTMYRYLAANGEVKERRNQLRHPIYEKPELLAEAPNEVWSWRHHEASRPGQVELLPPVRDPGHLQSLRRGLDGCSS